MRWRLSCRRPRAMQTKTKLIMLKVTGELIGWGWFIASLAALYFSVAAVAWRGTSTPFLWAVGIGIVCKRLTRGFHGSKIRVAYESELVERGLTPEQARKAWCTAYEGGRDRLEELKQLEVAYERWNEDTS